MGLLGALEMDDAEEQWIFGGVQQHEGGALQTQLTPWSSWSLRAYQSLTDIPSLRIYLFYFCDVAEKREVNKWLKKRSHRDVGLVDIVFAPFLGNKQHPVEEE